MTYETTTLWGMPPVARSPEIDALVAAGAPVAIGVSGGKDSQAAAIAVKAHLDAVGHAGPVVLVHADLGSEVEWEDSLPACRRLSAALGIELVVVSAGSMMERWERRWLSSVRRYATLSTVTLVLPWSTTKMRFCTSEMKTHPIQAALRRRFGRDVINVTGVRRDESANRAKGTVHDLTKDGKIHNWRPLSDWTEAQVFAAIRGAGQTPHEAYVRHQMTRVSCRYCMMSSIPDLRSATAAMETWDTFRRMVRLECASTFAFQGSRWLADAAPHLLSAGLARDVAAAKERATARRAAESRVTKGMLYAKGWPTRMLTDAEADVLADVRREVSGIVGIEAGFVDREAIHGRYAELIAARPAERLAA